jgi:hypothetical protein
MEFLFNLFGGGTAILNAVSWVVYLLMELVATFFTIAGALFDWVIIYVFNPDIYNIGAIYNGWTIARDTANLFFIFILLTIAIATILRIERYGAKALLPQLIIVAFLINFSFLASQYVIFAGNSLASLFLPTDRNYASMHYSEQFIAGLQPNAMFASFEITDIPNETELNKKMEELKEEGIKIQGRTSLTDQAGQEKLQDMQENQKLRDELKNQKENTTNAALRRSIIVMIGNTVLMLVAMFVLGTVVILLLARIVILWFLMILSPVAFLFWVLPGLQDQANKWWSTLLNQAFWPAAFFFLFNITLNMVADGTNKIFSASPNLGKAFISNPTVVLYYLLLVMMLFISLVVAKSMGGAGAAMALNLAKGARKYAGGYAGGYAYRAGMRGVGRIAEGLSTEERRGAIVRELSRIPLVGGMMGGAAVRQLEKAKKLGGLEKIRERQLESAKMLSSRDRAAYISTLGLAARENIINTLPENEVAQILRNPALSPEQKNNMEESVKRLSGKKQENIRYEQFKLMPESERPKFFNEELSPEMQQSFVREKASSTDIASLYKSNVGDIRKTIGSDLEQSSAERQQKFASEYGQTILKLNSKGIAEAFESLTDNLRGQLIDFYKKADIQKIAGAYEKEGSGKTFIQRINSIKPERTVEALSVLPNLASLVAGTSLDAIVGKIDFVEISEDAATADRDASGKTVMEQLAYKATDKQVGDIVMRGGKILDAFMDQLKKLGNNVTDISDKLHADKSPIASWVERRGERMLGLPKKSSAYPQRPTLYDQFGKPI